MASYEEIVREHRAHLAKGHSIQLEANKFVDLEPGPFWHYDPVEYGPDVMEAAFRARREWETQLLDIYRREIAARAADG